MKIDDYGFGRITIDGRTYVSDVLIWPEGIDASWRRRQGHSLCSADLEAILVMEPDALVIGQGAYRAMQVQEGTLERIRERCEDVYAGDTRSACKRFNELSAGEKRVAAALHLTC